MEHYPLPGPNGLPASEVLIFDAQELEDIKRSIDISRTWHASHFEEWEYPGLAPLTTDDHTALASKIEAKTEDQTCTVELTTDEIIKLGRMMYARIKVMGPDGSVAKPFIESVVIDETEAHNLRLGLAESTRRADRIFVALGMLVSDSHGINWSEQIFGTPTA